MMWGEDTHTCTDADSGARKYLAAGRQARPPAAEARAANTCVWLNGLSASRVKSEDSCRQMSQSDRAAGRGVSESQQLASLAGRETAIGEGGCRQHHADTRGCHTNFRYSLNKAVEHPTCQSKTEAVFILHLTARRMAVGLFVAATRRQLGPPCVQKSNTALSKQRRKFVIHPLPFTMKTHSYWH